MKAGTNTSIRQHTSAFVSIRQHTSAYVSIRQHTSAYVSIPVSCLKTGTNTSPPKPTAVTNSLPLGIFPFSRGGAWKRERRVAHSQYLHFCTSKASKLSSSDLALFARGSLEERVSSVSVLLYQQLRQYLYFCTGHAEVPGELSAFCVSICTFVLVKQVN